MPRLRRRLEAMDETPSHYLMLNMGDFVAQVGNNNEESEIETQGIREANKYGGKNSIRHIGW